MKWHYGLIRSVVGKTTKHYQYSVHEIFEAPELKGEDAWTEEPIQLSWDEPEMIFRELEMIYDDLLYYPVYEIKNNKLVPIKKGKHGK